MKKSLLLAATLIVANAHAGGKGVEAAPVYTAENHPSLVQAAEELDSVGERGIETNLQVDPFHNVNDRWKSGAAKLIAMSERGEIKRGASIDDLVNRENKDLSPEAGSTGLKPGIPGVGGALAPAMATKEHVFTPGAPMKLPRTLQEGKTFKATEYTLPSPSNGGGLGLDMGAPMVGDTPTAEAEVPATVPDSTNGSEDVVLFEVLKPDTWKAAWDAYVIPNQKSIYLPGAIAAFFVAFMLGRAKRAPTKIRK